jgi:predicted Kef-type K+ transport protein
MQYYSLSFSAQLSHNTAVQQLQLREGFLPLPFVSGGGDDTVLSAAVVVVIEIIGSLGMLNVIDCTGGVLKFFASFSRRITITYLDSLSRSEGEKMAWVIPSLTVRFGFLTRYSTAF